jgi:GNAT superfamily N-acetyltransferase
MSFTYRYQMQNGISIVHTQATGDYPQQLEDIQNLAFPSLHPDERFLAEHYYEHVKVFPQGQFMAMDGDRVVGSTSTIRYAFEFEDSHHTFSEMLGGRVLSTHDPAGDWLYGLDVAVHPDYRRLRIARALYYARHQSVRALGLKGQLAGGMISGYGALKHQLSAQDYLEKLKSGEIADPTLTAQMKVGFEALQLLPGYLDDPISDSYAVLICLVAEKDIEGP